MDNSQKKLVIITASIVLHAVTLFVIFVLYHQPAHDLFADFDPSKAIDVTETVFYDPPSQQSQGPAQSEPDQEWGQFKPRASTLGDSMEMPDGPIGVEQPGQNSDESTTVSEDTQENGDDVGAPADTPHSLEFNPQIKFENEEPIVTSIGTKNDTQATPANAKTVTKKQARKALAGITRGYLQQLHDEGENLIKTLGGNPNKKPTAEQLKYERYLAKIQWCLQNAHSINQHKCMSQEPIEAAMRVFFVLDREGKMNNFKIVQSSGNAYVDQYMSALFASASNSFPPLPAYIKEDHFPLTYTILVNWNTTSPVGFSRY